ncbi:voltage-gated potassium channel [Lignipirellula cremea]|uniref:BK channel n=2 Tax=Lignipirellula cremea TaxID=2528010 RepID=A0A518E066_9BACT|nr:voltage-gated potassium channel [Lignipirellula cremea]
MRQWQRVLARFFNKTWVELSIGVLILLSVGLTLAEFVFSTYEDGSPQQQLLPALQLANHLVSCVFIVELLLRFAAQPSPRRFFREYWIDILAVAPSLLPAFHAVRVMRVVRLLRILRLFGLVSRVHSNFPYIVRRGMVEYLTVCALWLMMVLVGTGAMLAFEGKAADHAGISVQDAFWFSVYSMFAGEPIPGAPQTVAGRIVSVFILFMGMTIFAMLTGTVSAFMVERLRTKGRSVDFDQLENHTIICGWNRKVEIIVAEHRAARPQGSMTMVVITEWDSEPPFVPPELQPYVCFLRGDFTRVSTLKQAGIDRAVTCIIVTDTSGGRSEQDADARSILAALTVEKLNPQVYTCAEIYNGDYATHLVMGGVNDYVVSSEYSAYLMAQSTMNRGMMGVINELMTNQRGNQFYRVSLPEKYQGRTYADLFHELKEKENAILVAIHRADGQVEVNPREGVVEPGDEIVVIAAQKLRLR